MSAPSGNYRWRIVLLLFFATTINYIDRQVLSFTMIDETFRREMMGKAADEALTESDLDQFKVLYSYVDTVFKVAYALGFLLIGWLIDRVGTKRGFSISIILWSIAGILNAFIGSLRGLNIVRFMLGIGEAGNFPSAIKSVAEWFPKKERSFATGLFNAGTNVGIIATAALIPWLTIQFGWRFSFVATGLLGFLVLIAWLRIYHRPEEHPRAARPPVWPWMSATTATKTLTRRKWTRTRPRTASSQWFRRGSATMRRPRKRLKRS